MTVAPPPAPPHTDIQIGGWIQHIPHPMQPYALLMRLDRPIGTWLLLLPGWWAMAAASGGIHHASPHILWLFGLFAIGAVLMRGAGCVINDLWDRDLDKQVERTKGRPLAAGTVPPLHALMFTTGLLLISLIILWQLPQTAIWIGFFSLIPVILYPLAKRVTWYPQAILGLTFNIGAIMGWAAVNNSMSLAAWLLYAAGFFWTLGYDTIYAHQDIADDGIVGIKSTARKFGDKSPAYIATFYSLTAFLLHLAGIIINAGPAYYVLWAAVAVHFLWQVWSWNPEDAQDCLKTFRSNRDAGLIILAAMLVAAW